MIKIESLFETQGKIKHSYSAEVTKEGILCVQLEISYNHEIQETFTVEFESTDKVRSFIGYLEDCLLKYHRGD